MVSVNDHRTPFAKLLESLLTERGAIARLAERSKVSRPFISRIISGEVLPSMEMLEKLLSGFLLQADRDHLALEYAKLHVACATPQLRVLLNDDETPRDRLTRACEVLDPKTREALAVIVEGVSRAPEQGARAIQSLAAIVETTTAPSNIVTIPPTAKQTGGSGGTSDLKVAEGGQP